MHRSAFVRLALLAMGAFPAQAWAQVQVLPGVTVSGEAAVVSDYRFRGISYTDRKAALQGQVTVSHSSGVYANVFVSTLPKTDLLGTVEFDMAGGWSHALGKSGLVDVGVAYYTYPRSVLQPIDYAETYVRYTHSIGRVSATGAIAYCPKQNSLGHRENFNAGVDLAYTPAKSPVTLTAHLGRTAGAWAPDDTYLDWSVGVTFTHKHVRFNLQYIDTDVRDLKIAKPTALVAARLFF